MSAELFTKKTRVFLLITALMLCLAVLPLWTYTYYQLLRIAVFLCCAHVVYLIRSNPQMNIHFGVLIALAVLFNPFILITLERYLWLPIDLGCAIYFLNLSKKK